MPVRTFWQEPPYGADLTDSKGRITAPWHILFNFIAKFIGRFTVADFAVDPPSLVADDRAKVVVTVPNAAPGDFASASFEPTDEAIAIFAQVTAANTVSVWFRNMSAATVDLGSGTLRVKVEKST